MSFDLNLERRSTNKLNELITRKKLHKLKKSIARRRSLGFEAKVSKLPEPTQVQDELGEAYLYKVTLRLDSKVRDEQKLAENYRQILEVIQRNINFKGWEIKNETSSLLNVANTHARPQFNVPILEDSIYQTYFNDIYEREPHIRLTHDSVKMFTESGFKRRSHTLLHGTPASAKTSLFERFKLWYDGDGSEWENVLFLDAVSLTKAGLENYIIQLSDDGGLPPILVFEELEKTNMDNLLCLLSIMQSGYLMKTNARIGRKRVEVRSLIWATCNDDKILKAFRNGALWSRFSHKWECQRPSPTIMRKILEREVKAINGDIAWVDKVMDIVTNYKHVLDDAGDPRACIALLDGRERLMTGEYLKDLIAIKRPV